MKAKLLIALVVAGTLAAPSLSAVAAPRALSPIPGAEATQQSAELAAVLSSSFETERALILQQTNSLRAANGLAPLRLNLTLDAIAQDWSMQQARASTMSHRSNFASLYPTGWTYAAENVAAGYRPDAVVNAWAGSPGHRANLLSASTDIGIGVATDANGRYFYTQNFARYTSPSPQPPSAPLALSAPVNDGASLQLTWNLPSSVGAGAVTDYVVQYKRSTSSTWSTVADGVSTVRSYTFIKPSAGVTFNFRVQAKNAFGVGPFSSVVTVTTPTATPSAPMSLAAPINDGASLQLTWDAPASVGAGAVTDYVVQFKRSTSSTWSTVADGVSTVRSFTFIKPSAGVTFNFRVQAKNAFGVGPFSSVLTITTPR